MLANALVVMAKAPSAGAVKTRLSPALVPEDAARLAHALLVDQLNHVHKLETADLYLAFAPEQARTAMQQLAPQRFVLFAQEGSELGERMAACFAHLFSAGYRSVILIGSDLAAVPLEFFTEAYRFLENAGRRVVLGPAGDGGYYLLGCNQPDIDLFENMAWSHPRVLAQTLDKLTRLQIPYRLLPSWIDIDTPDDLTLLREALKRRSLADAMPVSANVLSSLRFD